MSISQHVDKYLEEQGLEEKAEVVPEDPCQVFEKDVVSSEDELEKARMKVADLLGGTP